MTRILIIGEAWGQHEALARKPFVGPSGQLLRDALRVVGIPESDCHFTNVFNLQPPANKILSLCGPKPEGIPGMPFLQRGHYVRAEFLSELTRLHTEIEAHAPNVVFLLGATACWAVLRQAGIRNLRGAPHVAPSGVKCLPSWHPAAVLRNMKLRPVFFSDVKKLLHESGFPEIRRPSRRIWLEPSIQDLHDFEAEHLQSASVVSTDIETKNSQITCIGFSADESEALVVPFWSAAKADGNYWPDAFHEIRAWNWVRHVCATYPLVGQNFNYDMNYLWRMNGIPCVGAAHDTMLLHHALEPEMEKGLGFLATLYTHEPSWKTMRTKGTLKKED